MKSRILAGMMMAIGSISFAQQTEVDDMYFTSKDRVKANEFNAVRRSEIKDTEDITPLNPTDSYSARNVNPEYISRVMLDPNSQAVAAPYFAPNYQPQVINQNLSNINNTGWDGWSSWRNPNRMAMGFNSFNTNPGFAQNSWAFNNYWFSPWSTWAMMTMGPGWGGGMSWNPNMMWNNWGMNSMWNNGWNNPWAFNSMGWNNGWNGWGWGNGWNNGWNTWGNGWGGNTMVVVNNGDRSGREVVYGTRNSRSSDLNNNVTNSDRRTSYVDANGRNRGSDAGGRVASDNNTNYYDRGWRGNPAANSTGSGNAPSRSGNSTWWVNDSNSNSGSGSSSWSSGRGSSSGYNGGGGSNFSSGGGRSSGGMSGGSAGGSGGGGRTRGRD